MQGLKSVGSVCFPLALLWLHLVVENRSWQAVQRAEQGFWTPYVLYCVVMYRVVMYRVALRISLKLFIFSVGTNISPHAVRAVYCPAHN